MRDIELNYSLEEKELTLELPVQDEQKQIKIGVAILDYLKDKASTFNVSFIHMLKEGPYYVSPDMLKRSKTFDAGEGFSYELDGQFDDEFIKWFTKNNLFDYDALNLTIFDKNKKELFCYADSHYVAVYNISGKPLFQLVDALRKIDSDKDWPNLLGQDTSTCNIVLEKNADWPSIFLQLFNIFIGSKYYVWFPNEIWPGKDLFDCSSEIKTVKGGVLVARQVVPKSIFIGLRDKKGAINEVMQEKLVSVVESDKLFQNWSAKKDVPGVEIISPTANQSLPYETLINTTISLLKNHILNECFEHILIKAEGVSFYLAPKDHISVSFATSTWFSENPAEKDTEIINKILGFIKKNNPLSCFISHIYEISSSWFEYYHDPYYFCKSPLSPHIDGIDSQEYLHSEDKELEKFKNVLSKKELLAIIEKHTYKLFTFDDSVAVLKTNSEKHGKNENYVYPRYFIRKELRKRGVKLPKGKAEKYAKELGLE